MPLDPEPVANVEQARAWDGEEGAHWAAHPERYDEGLREHSRLLREVARIASHESVFDVGCGNGESTREAARAATAGAVVGLDLSSAMLARARATAGAEGLTNVEFVQGDAQVFGFEPESFDVVDQPVRRDVLRGSGRRVREHRPRAEARRPHRHGRLAPTGRERVALEDS